MTVKTVMKVIGLFAIFAMVNTAALWIAWDHPHAYFVAVPAGLVDLTTYGFVLVQIMKIGERYMDDQQPSGFIEYEGTLTEEQFEDLKRRFLEAQKTEPIRVIRYPEIDYPQEIRDQHESWLPQVDAMIEQYESVVAELIDPGD